MLSKGNDAAVARDGQESEIDKTIENGNGRSINIDNSYKYYYIRHRYYRYMRERVEEEEKIDKISRK